MVHHLDDVSGCGLYVILIDIHLLIFSKKVKIYCLLTYFVKPYRKDYVNGLTFENDIF